MKIVIIGATGYVGAGLLREALERGHEVTAVVRNPEKLPHHPRLTAAQADLYDPASVASVVAGHDAVLNAFSPGLADPKLFEHHVAGARAIIGGIQRAGVRLLSVGGAGTLEVAPGRLLVDTPEFPAQWKQTALATREVLNLLRTQKSLAWTFLSPPAHLEPGQRTGVFRTGTEQLLVDAKGESRISLQDYAVAMLDELEKPRHTRQRFTVAY